MLERIFGSTTRLKLLKHFLFRPEERFSLPQVVKLLKIKQETLKREIDNLVKFGVLATEMGPETILRQHEEEEIFLGEEPAVEEEKKKEVKLFFLNRQFVLNEELKTLIVRAQILYERDFIDKLLTVGSIKLLILTGLFVNRQGTSTDLLLVGRINKVKLNKIIKEFEKELGREINFTHFEATEFIYRRNIADIFLYEILEGDKMVVIDELTS